MRTIRVVLVFDVPLIEGRIYSNIWLLSEYTVCVDYFRERVEIFPPIR